MYVVDLKDPDATDVNVEDSSVFVVGSVAVLLKAADVKCLGEEVHHSSLICRPTLRWYVPRSKAQHKKELYLLKYTSVMLFRPAGIDQKSSTFSRCNFFNLSSPVAGSDVIFVPCKNLENMVRKLMKIMNVSLLIDLSRKLLA